MRIGNTLISVYLTLIVPFFIFFIYNLGKYEVFSVSMNISMKNYLPIFPILIVTCYMLLRVLQKRNLFG